MQNQYYQGQPQQPQRPDLPPRKPDNYLVWAILTTLFCCLPFGIVAIVKSSKVDSLWYAGYYNEALQASNEAKKWSIISAVVGVSSIVLYILLQALLIGALFSASI